MERCLFSSSFWRLEVPSQVIESGEDFLLQHITAEKHKDKGMRGKEQAREARFAL